MREETVNGVHTLHCTESNNEYQCEMIGYGRGESHTEEVDNYTVEGGNIEEVTTSERYGSIVGGTSIVFGSQTQCNVYKSALVEGERRLVCNTDT